MNNFSDLIVSEKEQILSYLKARFPLFHNSNFFFRDLQYGIRSYFEKKGIVVKYPQAEKLAYEFAELLEKENIFLKINHQSWKVNFPDYVTAQPGDPFNF